MWRLSVFLPSSPGEPGQLCLVPAADSPVVGALLSARAKRKTAVLFPHRAAAPGDGAWLLFSVYLNLQRRLEISRSVDLTWYEGGHFDLSLVGWYIKIKKKKNIKHLIWTLGLDWGVSACYRPASRIQLRANAAFEEEETASEESISWICRWVGQCVVLSSLASVHILSKYKSEVFFKKLYPV